MNYYEILGIKNDSSIDEIKKAYHRKAHENHPDKGGDESKMKLINNAYFEIVNSRKFNFPIEPVSRDNPKRPVSKCTTCGDDTYYVLCLDCWIKTMREEKRQRVHNIRSFMLCLNCGKSLYNRKPNTLFCDIKCSKEYYKKSDRAKSKKTCSHGYCLSKEEAYRLKNIELEKIIGLKRSERTAIFRRLIGKNKAKWFDTELQNRFNLSK